MADEAVQRCQQRGAQALQRLRVRLGAAQRVEGVQQQQQQPEQRAQLAKGLLLLLSPVHGGLGS